jgi:energy-coupling factor transporter ATP-binding protein EcfA2
MARKKPNDGISGKRQTTQPKTGNATAAYFLSLSVRNTRCFGEEEQTLDLSDGASNPAHWTLILGENGTGKTTLLQALAITVDWTRNIPTSLNETQVRDYFYSTAYLWDELRRNRQDFFESPYVRVRIASCHNGLKGNPKEYQEYWMKGFPSVETSGGPNPTPQCYSYGAGRRSSSTEKTFSRHPFSSSLFFDDALLQNASDWLIRLDYASLKLESEATKKRLRHVTETLIELLPDVRNIRIVSADAPEALPEVQFETPYGWVPIERLGYGYRSLVAWVVDLASRMFEAYPESDNPLLEPAVCLVDEIDLHLHPTWQREVMQYLSRHFPNVQFIATAHSPLIVQSAPEVNANVVVLRRDGDHVIIDNNVDVVRGWRIEQILASDIFNVPPRSPEVQKILDRQATLLSMPSLTAEEQEELASLNKQVDELPVGRTLEEDNTLSVLKQTLDVLQKATGKRK